jgi:hypothetical protein
MPVCQTWTPTARVVSIQVAIFNVTSRMKMTLIHAWKMRRKIARGMRLQTVNWPVEMFSWLRILVAGWRVAGIRFNTPSIPNIIFLMLIDSRYTHVPIKKLRYNTSRVLVWNEARRLFLITLHRIMLLVDAVRHRKFGQKARTNKMIEHSVQSRLYLGELHGDLCSE